MIERERISRCSHHMRLGKTESSADKREEGRERGSEDGREDGREEGRGKRRDEREDKRSEKVPDEDMENSNQGDPMEEDVYERDEDEGEREREEQKENLDDFDNWTERFEQVLFSPLEERYPSSLSLSLSLSLFLILICLPSRWGETHSGTHSCAIYTTNSLSAQRILGGGLLRIREDLRI